MPQSKIITTISLKDKECDLIAQAQEKYKLDGKGHLSYRMLVMVGVYNILGLDIAMDS